MRPKRILDKLALRPDETFVDFGCGPKAHIVRDAANRFGCRCLGIEIDEGMAKSSAAVVRHCGLDHLVTIVHADAATAVLEADVGYAYQFPETLEAFLPAIRRLRRFASGHYAVPGLEMRRCDETDAYYWERPC